MIRILYSLRDHNGMDHLATQDKRTLCGLPWMTHDALHGFMVGHATHPSGGSRYSHDDCARCLVHLSVMQHRDGVSQVEQDEHEMPF